MVLWSCGCCTVIRPRGVVGHTSASYTASGMRLTGPPSDGPDEAMYYVQAGVSSDSWLPGISFNATSILLLRLRRKAPVHPSMFMGSCHVTFDGFSFSKNAGRTTPLPAAAKRQIRLSRSTWAKPLLLRVLNSEAGFGQ